MQQRLFALRRAVQSGAAARDGFIFRFAHRRAAYRAARGQHEAVRVARTFIDDYLHDFGYDVAGPPHHHRIAHPYVLALHFVVIVQCCVGDGHSADEHRLQPRYRRQRARAADLDVDTVDHGRRLLGRKLMGKRKARCARHEAQLILGRQIINFIDDTVDVERESGAAGAHRMVIIEHPRHTPHHLALGSHRKTKLGKPLKHARMPAQPAVDRRTGPVGIKRETARRRDTRIELAQ